MHGSSVRLIFLPQKDASDPQYILLWMYSFASLFSIKYILLIFVKKLFWPEYQAMIKVLEN